MSTVLLLSEFFGAVKEIAKLIPEFDERKKEKIEKETEIYIDMENRFHNAAVAFKVGSRSDELLGLADLLNDQENKLKKLYIIYAKELKDA